MAVRTWERTAASVLESVVAIDIVEGMSIGYDPVAGGSGFVVTESGYIMTNAHVADTVLELPLIMPELWVRFHSGERYIAHDIWISDEADIALIKIEAGTLRPLVMEESTPGRGAGVAMIGNAYPFEWTFTAGVFSRRGKLNGEDLLQHTADLNPGCSGSPLVNSEGRVVGVNVAIVPSMRGINFAVPADIAISEAAKLAGVRL
jgi:serine protease Do